MKTCFKTKMAGFPIVLRQRKPNRFQVQYGEQIDDNLTYSEAAAKLGQAIMHALACEARLDNSPAS